MSAADEKQALEHLLREVGDHEMAVQLDEGLHRHIRFAKPGTSIYQFDLITWPGYLVIAGDLESLMFRRLPDMFEFFGSRVGYINAHYWSEKLVGPRGRNAAKTFSFDLFQQRVREYFDEYVFDGDIDPAHVWQHIEDQVLQNEWGEVQNDHEAHQLLEQFSSHGFQFADAWEWDLTDFDYHFLLSCHAIVWGIARYRAEKLAEVPA